MFRQLIIIFIFVSQNILSQDWVTNINKKYSPAVVVVYIIKNEKKIGHGSGINIDESGLIVTNYHVVEKAESVLIKFANGDGYTGLKYLYVDPEKDFVLIKIAGHNLPTIKLGNSDEVETGNEVVAIGSPEFQLNTVTKGIISGKRSRGGFSEFQTDVSVAKGSSGGPLFNNKQEVIALTTSGIKEGLGLNFAIPINYVIGANKASTTETEKKIGFDIVRKQYSQTQKTSKQEIKLNQKNEDINKNQFINNLLYCYFWYLIILGLMPAYV